MESVQIPRIDSQSLRANKLALVERLADDLAHEIKNPLHSMVINLEVLKRRVSRWSGADATDLMRYVGVLSSELDRVNQRVDLLLRMVRPDRSGGPIPLAEMLDELLELVELERERQAISIEVTQPDFALRASLPRDVGRHIVLNLLVAGLDAAGQGGRLSIFSSREPGEDLLRIRAFPAIDHDGLPPGGADEEQERRSMAALLAESLGGRVEVSPLGTTPSDGTEFSLALPATPS